MQSTSLRGRSALILLLINLVVGAMTVAAFLGIARGLSTAFSRRFAEKQALLDRSRILAPIEREVALAQKLADSEVLRLWCRSERDPAARRMALAELDSFRRAFADHSYFFIPAGSRSYYFNNAGNQFAGRELRYTLDPSRAADRWYFEAMGAGPDYSLHVDSAKALGLLKVWINVLVKDQGRRVGMAGTGVDLSAFMKEASQSGDRAVTTVLVDGRGILQAYPNPAYMEFNARMKDEDKRMTLRQLLGGAEDRTQLQYRLNRLVNQLSPVELFPLTVEGRRYLVAATYMKDIDWVNLALVDPSKVMGLRPFLPILGLMVLALLATIALVSLLLDRVVLKPLERLTGSVQRVAQGDYGIELPLERRDEIGQLTGAFNHMAATIRDHTANLERKVAERTELLSQANRKLLESSRKITESLDYAHLIQASMLPKPETMAAAIPDHCVLYRPRDIVGGDFYSLVQDPDGFLVAVGDCAGHGVPGAFMSMSACAVLEQLLAKLGPEDPARILGELNEAMKSLLHQSERARGSGRLDNGLDLALLRVAPGRNRIRFAGARLPLWTFSPGAGLLELKGDSQSLGYRRSATDFQYTNLDLALEPGTSCYLFTDGILDQNGGPQGFGFGQRRLRRAILDMAALPMARQHEILEGILREYQGANLQRDDITFMGFRSGPGPVQE
jgi:serine phosphatase RsbU (regulator of sigma subunit)